MPRVTSNDKRSAILAATIHLIVTRGLSAPTMGIAKEAGIPNGSLFTYFPTKADLFNQLYLELTLGDGEFRLANAALDGAAIAVQQFQLGQPQQIARIIYLLGGALPGRLVVLA